jgi:hypothetical protein
MQASPLVHMLGLQQSIQLHVAFVTVRRGMNELTVLRCEAVSTVAYWTKRVSVAATQLVELASSRPSYPASGCDAGEKALDTVYLSQPGFLGGCRALLLQTIAHAAASNTGAVKAFRCVGLMSEPEQPELLGAAAQPPFRPPPTSGIAPSHAAAVPLFAAANNPAPAPCGPAATAASSKRPTSPVAQSTSKVARSAGHAGVGGGQRAHLDGAYVGGGDSPASAREDAHAPGQRPAVGEASVSPGAAERSSCGEALRGFGAGSGGGLSLPREPANERVRAAAAAPPVAEACAGVTAEQQLVLDSVATGCNVFFTGACGHVSRWPSSTPAPLSTLGLAWVPHGPQDAWR